MARRENTDNETKVPRWKVRELNDPESVNIYGKAADNWAYGDDYIRELDLSPSAAFTDLIHLRASDQELAFAELPRDEMLLSTYCRVYRGRFRRYLQKSVIYLLS